MKLKHIGVRPREIAPADGRPFRVEPGETFEVDDKLGAALLRQKRRFTKAATPKPKSDSKDGD